MLLAADTALVAGGAGAVTVDKPQVASVARKAPKGPATARDEASALLTARLQKRRIEVLSERTETATMWAYPDGHLRLEQATGPVRFRHKGVWTDVDLTLAKQADGSIGPAAHPRGLALSGRDTKGNSELASLKDGKRQVRLTWPGTLPQPRLKGTKATYRSVKPGVDLVVETTRTGFEDYLIVRSEKAAESLGTVKLALHVDGLKLKDRGDGGQLLTAKGKTLGMVEHPTGWDAELQPNSQDPTDTAKLDIDSQVSADGDRATVSYRLDEDYVRDRDTKFPVTIDPGISLRPSLDTFVEQGYTSDRANDKELKLGNNGTGQAARSFLAFNTSSLRGKETTDATLKLYNYRSWSCSKRAWEIWDTGAPDHHTRWTHQPRWNKKITTSMETKGSTVSGDTGCPADWTSIKIPELVKQWSGHGPATAGIGLRATDERDKYTWKRFSSAEGDHPPTLAVNMTPSLEPPTHLSASPGHDTVGKRYVSTLTPELSGTVTSGTGTLTKVAFEVSEPGSHGHTHVITTHEQDGVPSGQQARWSVPKDTLKTGHTYRFRMRAYDGHNWSGWSGYYSFTTYNVAAPTPHVSSHDFPKSAWGGKRDDHGQYGGSFNVNSDTYTIAYRIDDGSWTEYTVRPKVTAHVPITVSAGKHTLYVRGLNRAGKPTPTVEYPFYAGPGAALTRPASGARSARRVVLAAEGKPAHTGVTYQYRRAATDDWTTIPAKDVRTADNKAVTWPVPVNDGKPQALIWTVADTVDDDGSLSVRAHFTGGKSVDTDAHRMVFDRDAGFAPQPSVGPGNVNLLTGAFSMTHTDASEWGVTVQRTAISRSHTTAAELGLAQVFGPGWTAGGTADATGAAYVAVRKTSKSSVEVMFADGDGIDFTRTSHGWRPEVGAEDLTLTGSETDGFTLTDTDGTKSTFTKVDPKAPTWVMTSSALPTKHSTTRLVYEPTTWNGQTLARPKYLVAPTSAVDAAVCAKSPQTRGCRVLEYVYTEALGQVSQIRLWATKPGDSQSTSTVETTYTYDHDKQLISAADPRTSPGLKTTYAYDAAHRVTKITPPGEQPWTMTYGKATDAPPAGDGMLLKVSRPALKSGSKSDTDGVATTSVAYEVPVSGSGAPAQMASADVAAWGQDDTPTDATAIFPPDAVPSSNDGTKLGKDDYKRATIAYIDASGRQVNAREPGGPITTAEYDRFGNLVRTLTAGNRKLALATTDNDRDQLKQLGLDPQSTTTAERADELSTVSHYSADGLRELDTRGPRHAVTLQHDFKDVDNNVAAQGSKQVVARDWTHRTFDEGRPVEATVKDLPTTQSEGLELPGHPEQMAETRTTGTGYDWATGLVTKTVEDPKGLAITHTVSYDETGQPIQSTLPKSGGSTAGTVLTDYYTATGSGRCGGRPEWADLPCRSYHAAPADTGDNRQLPDQRTEYDRYGMTVKTTETANGATRTTSIDYDPAGRIQTASLTSSIGQPLGARKYTYDPTTGRATGVTSEDKTLHTTYDTLGRVVSYTDSDGNTATTEYDRLDRPTKVTDGAPSTTTYTYDTDKEPRGLPTSLAESKVGTITGRYDEDGALTEQTLPGGVSTHDTFDPAGVTTSRTYSRGEQAVTSEGTLPGAHGQSVGRFSTATGWQGAEYDTIGRLTRTVSHAGTAESVCTAHDYTYDGNSNRQTKAISTSPHDKCGGGTPTTVKHSYDSADRLSDTAYTYDEFGDITHQPGNVTNGYYAGGSLRLQQTNTQRTQWQLDPAGRRRSTSTEPKQGDTYGAGTIGIDHFDGDTDAPAWTENKTTGAITRYIRDLAGNLIATSNGTTTQLQLPDLHGDTTVSLDADGHATVRAFDEFGAPWTKQPQGRYGWLGAHQRSADTPTGNLLMGARLYDPDLGRFLQPDPLSGGSANAYDYSNQDPVNASDLTGLAPQRSSRQATHSSGRTTTHASVTHHTSRTVGQRVTTGKHTTHTSRITQAHQKSTASRRTTKWKTIKTTTKTGAWHNSMLHSAPKWVQSWVNGIISHYLHGISVEKLSWQRRTTYNVQTRYHNGKKETRLQESWKHADQDRYRVTLCHDILGFRTGCQTITSPFRKDHWTG
ncbi:DNRLRE domain-containing protein [Streptomyces boninensis]|uniref:DNRLRE domain-containing protein n=1 Tax=Streptomyces boninensis TaxID=2039455 RepID=UPI003B20FB1A